MKWKNLYTQNLYNIEELETIIANSKEYFTNYTDYISAKSVRGGFTVKELPEFSDKSGLDFSGFNLTATLTYSDNILEVLESALDACYKNNLTQDNPVSIGIDIPQATTSGKESYINIKVGFGKSYTVFGYSLANIDKAKDLEYRQEHFRKLITLLNLPLKIMRNDSEFYFSHNFNGYLHSVTVGRLDIKNQIRFDPEDFSCQIDVNNISEMIDLIRKYLDNFDYSTDCNGYFRLSTNEKKPESAIEIYGFAKNLKLPADSFNVEFSCRINDLNGMELLRTLIKKKSDEFKAVLCNFLVSDTQVDENVDPGNSSDYLDWCELNIKATKRGYNLNVQLSLAKEENIKKIEDYLGIKLEWE